MGITCVCGGELRNEIVQEDGKSHFTLFCPKCFKRFDRCQATQNMRHCVLPIGHEGMHQHNGFFWHAGEDTELGATCALTST